MRIAIIGAGFTGLVSALRLSQKGHQVIIFEKEKGPGGLATGFKQKNWAWTCEYFFHHLFASDRVVRNLISELGLNNKLFFEKPKTSIYFKGRISRFDSPISVLTFPHLSLHQKIRTGIVTAYLKLSNNWQQLEKITAIQWLKKFYGEKTYQILWKPLLKSKFGEFFDQIPASWFWTRIKKRSTKLGYFEGSFQTLINELAKKIKTNGGQILLEHEIKSFSELKKFDRIIFTTPTSIFLKIMNDKLPKDYQQKLNQLKMIGVVYLIFTLKESFLKDGTYWLNVNDSSFPFVAVVEHTNFIDKSHYGNNHILYVGGYYPQNHRYFRGLINSDARKDGRPAQREGRHFKMTKEEILKEWLPYLQKINPKFSLVSLITSHISRSLYAQPIVPLNYSKIIPSYQTPVKNVFLACMQQVYPWDRGINYAVAEGEKIAQLVNS
ncbi:MAG: NAD(P)/FAD-dependent oxidoreductase [Candidatus Shapirobacteria bacterium]|nr:NAD(P)/FAD-dependent oxidoreductase [Candidatus Shapirobacteria bacterium]